MELSARFVVIFLMYFLVVVIASANGRMIQMEQEKVQNEADQAMADLINYWNHMKQIHSEARKYREEPLKIVEFSWSDCGKAADSMHVSQLSVGPDPVKLPGNVSISVHGQIMSSLTAPVQVNLEVHKKVLIWVKVPCIDNIGSCSYADACALNPFASKPCPPIFVQKKLPCKCPVTAGKYGLDKLTFFVNPTGVPSWLEDGSYRVTARLSKGGQELGCVNLAFSVTK